MYSDIEIKDIFYSLLKDSELVAEVNGTLRKRKRPLNSRKEDVCIYIAANEMINTQTQNATIYVRVYVPMQKEGKQLDENDKRLRQLCELSKGLSEYNGGDFRFTMSSQKVIETEDGEENFIINIYNFTANNE